MSAMANDALGLAGPTGPLPDTAVLDLSSEVTSHSEAQLEPVCSLADEGDCLPMSTSGREVLARPFHSIAVE